jgi:hypothetical protein
MTKPKKKIYTLVQDVYDTVNKGVDIPDSLLDEFCDNIKKVLKKVLKEGLEGQPAYLRPSNIGTPPRKLWYTIKQYPGATITPDQAIQFMYGHLIEEFVVLLVKLAGHTVENRQLEVTLDGIKGSQDADIDGILMDIKGMSPFGFDKFATGRVLQEDSFGYIPQISTYAQGRGRDFAGFLAFDKQRGRLATLLLDEFDLVDAREKIKSAKVIIESDTPPERCFPDEEDGASGNRILGKQCSWCGFKKECWKDSNDGKGLRAFEYKEGDGTRIDYFTVIKKTPRVKEVEI